MSEYDWEDRIKRIENGIDLSILYLHIANKLDTSKEFRDLFNEMINNYLKQNNITLKEIWERNQDRMNNK